MARTKYKGKNPGLLLGETGSQVDMKCHGRSLTVGQELDEAGDTYCGKGSVEYVEIEVLNSTGSEGLQAQLRPMVGQSVPFVFTYYDGDPASVDKPWITGDVEIPPFPFAQGGIDEFQPFTIRMDRVGDDFVFVTA